MNTKLSSLRSSGIRPGVFFGTPEFACACLQALIQAELAPRIVVTNPDRPTGRGRRVLPSPVATLAKAHCIAVFQPPSIAPPPPQLIAYMRESQCAVVAAYGGLLPTSLLYAPRFGCLNVHASLLPRWRGASPIQQALLAGDSHTGVTIMQMNEGLDCGDILLREHCTIDENETAYTLQQKLQHLSATTLVTCLQQYHRITPETQQHDKATYAHKFTKSQARIDWRQTAIAICRLIRAYNPTPIAWTCFATNMNRIRIWQASVHSSATLRDVQCGQILAVDNKGIEVACGKGSILIHLCQLAGGKVLDVASLLRSQSEICKVGGMLV